MLFFCRKVKKPEEYSDITIPLGYNISSVLRFLLKSVGGLPGRGP